MINPLLRYCSLFLLLLPASFSSGQVRVIEAPSNVEFVDMGYDVLTDEVKLVGHVFDAGEEIATVFELNDDESGFDSEILVDLPGAAGNAQVLGISSEGLRIAGASVSPESIDGEGVTWLSNSPEEPVGIGFLFSLPNSSGALGAWSDGVVGECGGLVSACTWSEDDGIEALPGTCLLYTSPSPRDRTRSRMPSSA